MTQQQTERSRTSAFRVVIAPDSFKGSLTSTAVAQAMARGVQEAYTEAQLTIVPMADGGEGTVEAILAAAGGTWHTEQVVGPVGTAVAARYGMLTDGKTAVIEMAEASGLPYVPAEARNPLLTTSYGTGQLIKAALDRGAKRLLIGLGGSATNDGGMGMAQALGVQFRDVSGAVMEEQGCGQLLERIASIDVTQLDARLADVQVVVLSDVTNPLCGESGASAVYGPQKGATPDMVEHLDRGLGHYAALLAQAVGKQVADVPGAGAAGGMGAGLLAIGQTEMKPGIEVVMEVAQFASVVGEADLVLTGEGRTDAQTAFGKVPAGIAAVAQAVNVPVVCLSGGVEDDAASLYTHGITALFSIADRPMTLDDAMQDGERLLTKAARDITRLYRQGLVRGAVN